MKDLKFTTIVFVVGLALLAQLASATQVHADGEATPLPAYTPAAVDTPREMAVPTEIPMIESSTPEPISDTPAPANSSVPDTASNTPLPAVTNPPTSAPTDGTLVESPTPDMASSKPAPNESSTPDTASNTPLPVVTDPPTSAPTDGTLVESPTPDMASRTPLPEDSSTPDTASNTPRATVTNPPASTTTDSASPTQEEAWSVTPTLLSPSSATTVPPTQTLTQEALSPAATSSATPTIASVEKNTPTPEPPMATVESPSETLTPVGASTTGAVVPTEEPTLLDSVQALSSDTSVVVLDQNGQPLPLAAQDAAEAVVNGDPMWCPNAVAPGGAGCTSNFISMSELLTLAGSYINNQNVNGTIWITSGTQFDTGPIIIDGSAYTNWANNSLTLQGGWSGIYGDTTIGAINSEFSVPIHILNWNAVVTINNIAVRNAAGSGLGVTTNGKDVVINNSSFSNNSSGSGNFPWGDGADIFPNGGNVTVTNSRFSRNNWDGLYIVNSGNISISDSNLNSDGTSGYGGGLDAYGVNTIDINNSEFDLNQSYDILAYCNTGNSLNVSFTDLLRLNITINNNCMVNASVATPTPIPTQTGTLPAPTSTPTGPLPSSTPTSTPLPPLVVSTSTAPPTPLNGYKIQKVQSLDGSHNRLPQSHAEIYLECATQLSFTVPLPNGDKVEIICPSPSWSGKATISRLDNTALPGELPSGYTYASAFQVDISQLKEPIQVIGGEIQRESVDVIPKGGYIKASFVALTESTYSILYWDNRTWIPLKDFILDENGEPQVFDLHPGSQEDPRKIIIRGVENIDNRVEVSVNFPGIFVLVQHQ